MAVSDVLKSLFGGGHERTVRLKRNVLGSFLFRGVSAVLGLLLVPLMLDYLNPVKYGIWLTISAMLGWISVFDIGLGNGLRNRFAEALANQNPQLARTYVSTAYAALSAIVVILFVLFLVFNSLVSWTAILNTPPGLAEDVNTLVFLMVAFVLPRFVFGLINTIAMANQSPAISAALDAVASLMSLFAVVVLATLHTDSLALFGGVLAGISALVPLIASLFLFSTRYKMYSPSPRYVRMGFIKDLSSLGIKFFLLQIIFIIIFATDNLIISQLFGPAEVTPYNVAFRYFNLVVTLFAIVTTPLWSAFTEAYARQDFGWIRVVVSKTQRLWIVLAIATIVMLIFSSLAYGIWIGHSITVPFSLSLVMCLFTLVTTWNGVFTQFVNGIGKVRLQLLFAAIVGILNIPVSIIFAKYFGMGPAGVMLGTVVCLIPGSILTPLQYHKIITNRATGIWAQ